MSTQRGFLFLTYTEAQNWLVVTWRERKEIIDNAVETVLVMIKQLIQAISSTEAMLKAEMFMGDLGI